MVNQSLLDRKQRKLELRERKAQAQQQKQQQASIHTEQNTTHVDCACLIHGDYYSWNYVEKLYSMLTRHLSKPVRFHVYTEPGRTVPAPWIKHSLEIWPGFDGPKRAWWYKLQLFNPAHHQGPLLYFDLDCVIVNNIDWLTQGSVKYFWAIKDFKCLWRPTVTSINSSVMWWDTRNFSIVWDSFAKRNIMSMSRRYHGDQDYISDHVALNKRRFFDSANIESWRWQAHDGGFNFKKKKSLAPGSGTRIASQCSVLVFHGRPKPHETNDPVIAAHWL